MRLRLERRIAYLQNILNVRYPIELVSTVQVIPTVLKISPLVEPPPVDILFNSILRSSAMSSIPEVSLDTNTPIPLPNSMSSTNILEMELCSGSAVPLEIEQLDDGFTDIPEEELQQRDAEQKQLQDALTQLELDKLMKRKPRVKK